MKNAFVIDVETDGPCPGMFNMIEFGIVSVEDNSKRFHGKIYPDIMNDGGDLRARSVCGISWEEQQTFEKPNVVMSNAVDFIIKNSDPKERLVFWSDNNGFDWSFWNYYCHKYVGENPFGWSSRRIGDLFAGYKRKHRSTVQWKKFRKTSHDHNPVNDALGNAQALRTIVNNYENN